MNLKKSIVAQILALAWAPLHMADPAPATSGNGSKGGGSAKSTKMVDKDWDDAREGNGDIIYFRFKDGEVIELDMNEVPEENQRLLKFHGASQKCGDSFAGVKGDMAQAKINLRSTIDLLKSGEWEQEREGGGPRLAELAEAISRIKGVDLETCKQVVEAATPEERSQWRSNNTVKLEVAKMRAEKAQAAVDAQGQESPALNINFGERAAQPQA